MDTVQGKAPNSSTTDGEMGKDVTLVWTPEGEVNLRRGITQVTQRNGIVVILFGQTGFGKSSLANGIQTAMRGNRNVSNYFPVGIRIRTSGSYTKTLHRDDFCRQSCRENCTCEPYFWLIDMPGVFNNDNITDDSIEKIVTGAVPFYEEIKPTLEAMDSSSILPPQDRVKASCVVIVQKQGLQ
ncbi:uncharacterized protein LOC124273035 [Haliotis rubra]|uniref:uncharacterized protein LOC124273035 n=1 Tax=Haliotis rubra TaxID=36100 RepID=UPI001EE54662|nr:uncharacterized protein LOC124273035 [Haliotis rubra]